MADYGIKVSDTDKSVNDAELKELLLTSRYPFAKLDTSNDVSFRNILVRFSRDTPNPSGTAPDTELDTVVYSFPHGYDYVPSYWALLQVVAGSTATLSFLGEFQDGGIVAANGIFSTATVGVTVDETNVSFIVKKFYDVGGGVVGATPMTNMQIRIRVFVFVEELQ